MHFKAFAPYSLCFFVCFIDVNTSYCMADCETDRRLATLRLDPTLPSPAQFSQFIPLYGLALVANPIKELRRILAFVCLLAVNNTCI